MPRPPMTEFVKLGTRMAAAAARQSLLTLARGGGGSVCGGICASALRAASSILGDTGVSGDVAVDGDELLLSQDGLSWEDEGGDGGRGTEKILKWGMHHLVVSKTPSVICNYSGWAGLRSRAKRGEEPDILAQSPSSGRRESGPSRSCRRDCITW